MPSIFWISFFFPPFRSSKKRSLWYFYSFSIFLWHFAIFLLLQYFTIRFLLFPRPHRFSLFHFLPFLIFSRFHVLLLPTSSIFHYRNVSSFLPFFFLLFFFFTFRFDSPRFFFFLSFNNLLIFRPFRPLFLVSISLFSPFPFLILAPFFSNFLLFVLYLFISS